MTPRILIVEDNADLARALIRYFKRSGYEVVHASSCAQAARVTGSFDVGVLDLELSDGYGFDLCTLLRQRETVGSVVFFTGSVDAKLLERAERLAPCVSKCEGIEALQKVLEAALERQVLQAAGGDNQTPVPSTPRKHR